MAPLVLEILHELKKRDQNVKHGGKGRLQKSLYLKVPIQDVAFFSGKHNSYKEWACPFTYTWHAVHVVISESGILKGLSFCGQ